MLTPAQNEAIAANGDVLVAAGAGAGKTSTLVERCVQRLLDPAQPVSLDQILMVTFTEAAAAEMRARVRKRLEKELAAGPDPARAGHIEEQLALLDSAPISTLHSFCYKLVRQNFHALEIDPLIAVLDEGQAHLLMEETLDAIFERHYQSRPADDGGPSVVALLQSLGGGKEQAVRSLILQLHEYMQTRVDPQQWFDQQIGLFSQSEPSHWRAWLLESLPGWRDQWLRHFQTVVEAKRAAGTAPSIDEQKAEKKRGKPKAVKPSLEPEIFAALQSFSGAVTLSEFAAGFAGLSIAAKPPKHLEKFFEEAAFLRSLMVPAKGGDPLAEDWQWVRGDMSLLLQLVSEFATAFAAAKKEQGAIDFHDLEQFALRLLLDGVTGQPSALARRYQEQFKFLFIDECQDINAAQDAILRALSNPAEPNRFLVGDVKQSIYRFRLADPRIFQEYDRAWRTGTSGKVITLRDNFRSREALLDFFNAVFRDLMKAELGGVEFTEDAALVFGAPGERARLSATAVSPPCVHVHLRIAQKSGAAEIEESPVAELTNAEHEARIVADELRRLVDGGHLIYDEALAKTAASNEVSPSTVPAGFRALRWADIAILLRAPGSKAELYAREFARQQIPLQVAQNDFYESPEIADLLNVLTILDNPLQDIPLLAVLHSPLVGLTTDELATIRLAGKDAYWHAVRRFHERGAHDDALVRSAHEKVSRFVEQYARWRLMARDASLSQRLHTIITETTYVDWLAASQTNEQRAAQASANVRRLLALAEQFDPFQRQGITRFLRFVETQKDLASREPLAAGGNAVQLISIHRSKGLEYPVVVVPDLGKGFNTSDLTQNVILDRRFGLCPKVKPPHVSRRYRSVAHWLSARVERAELLGEEMRLLYVAMTRARDTLLLVGTCAKSSIGKWLKSPQTPADLLRGNSMLAWLGPWLAQRSAVLQEVASGGDEEGDAAAEQSLVFTSSNLFSVSIHESDSAEAPPAQVPVVAPFSMPENIADCCSRVLREYPYADATREAAKTSVSALRRKMKVADDESRHWQRKSSKARSEQPTAAPPQFELFGSAEGGGPAAATTALTSSQIGTAHHTFLEFADIRQLATTEAAEAQADALAACGILQREERASLDLSAIVRFWSGEVGREITAVADIRRELPFTARFDCAELPSLGLAHHAGPPGEWVIIQGVVDLVAFRDGEIWLLDFKTDDVEAAEVPERANEYRPQIQSYAAALARTFPGKTVTHRWLHFLRPGVTVNLA